MANPANPGNSPFALFGQIAQQSLGQCSGAKIGAGLAVSGAGALGYWLYLIVMGAAFTFSPLFLFGCAAFLGGIALAIASCARSNN